MPETETSHGTVSILGCGWLGFPLARRLRSVGFRVQGSTTSPEKLPLLADAGVAPFLLTVEDTVRGDDPARFFEADALVLNLPPGRRHPDVQTRFRRQVEAVCRALQGGTVPRVLFASSTSVYPDLDRIVTEEDAGPAPTASGAALLAAESLLQSSDDFTTTVVRLAGLIGYDRQPGRFLAAREGLAGGEAPVNLIHRDDCVEIFARILTAPPHVPVWGEVFNACADEHPSRRAFYMAAARRLGVPPPVFSPSSEGGPPFHFKVVSSAKLKRCLNYTFLYPDPLLALG